MIRFTPPLRPALFRRRLNRFAAEVSLNGETVLAHVPSSGRLRELFLPGAEVWLQPVASPRRKTAFTLKLVRAQNGVLVAIDTQLTNRLAGEGLRAGRFAPWQAYSNVRGEVRRGDSRLDFLLTAGARRCWVEVKSVTLVEDGVARFPDAPTARGRRHLAELTAARQAGEAAGLLFLVQREDGVSFAPNERTDPAFAAALWQAQAAGVVVRAYRCRVTPESVAVDFSASLPLHR